MIGGALLLLLPPHQTSTTLSIYAEEEEDHPNKPAVFDFACHLRRYLIVHKSITLTSISINISIVRLRHRSKKAT